MTQISPGYAICNNCRPITPIWVIRSAYIGGPIHSDFYQKSRAELISNGLSICAKCLFVHTEKGFKEIKDDIARESPWDELEEPEKQYPFSRRHIMLAERLEKEGGSKMEVACILRTKPATRSDPIRPLIPIQIVHPFRSNRPPVPKRIIQF